MKYLGIVNGALLTIEAIVILLTYITMVNDLQMRTYITINRSTEFRVLHIPFPFYKEMLILSVILMLTLAIMFEKKGSKVIFLLMYVIGICTIILTYVYEVRLIIPLLSILLLVVVLLSEKCRLKNNLKRISNILLIILTIICTYSAIRYLTFFLIPNEPFSEPSWTPVEFYHMLVHSLHPMMIGIYTLLPLIPLVKYVIIKSKLEKYVKRVKTKEIFSKEVSYLILWLSVLLTVIQNMLPYLPTVNPRMVPIGVDIIYYEMWTAKVIEKGIMEIFRQDYGRRPLYLLILYAMYYLLKIPIKNLAELMPTILLPTLVLSVFYMTYKISKSYSCAAMASLLTSTGIQTTVGIYASFQANIAALSLIYTSIGLIASISSRKTILVLFFMYLITELLHPSVVYVLIVLFMYGVLIRKTLTKIVSATCGTLLADLIKLMLSREVVGTTVGLSQETFIYLIDNLSENLSNYWETSYRLVSLYYGGAMTWPCILLISLSCLHYAEEIDKFITPWLIPLFAIYASSWSLYSRLLFNVPLQVILAHTIVQIAKDNKLRLLFFFSISLSYASLCTFNLIWAPL